MKFPEFRQKHVNFVIIFAAIVAAAGIWTGSYWQAQADHEIEEILVGNPDDLGGASTGDMLKAIMENHKISASSMAGVDASVFDDFYATGGGGFAAPTFVIPQLDFAGPEHDLISFTQALVPLNLTGVAIGSGTFSTATLTLTGNPTDTQTVAIDGKTYTFRADLTGNADGDVLVGADAEEAIEHLVAAINRDTFESEAGGGGGYDDNTTEHPTYSAIAIGIDKMQVLARLVGTDTNNDNTAETVTGTWDGNTGNGANAAAGVFGQIVTLARTCDGVADANCEDLDKDIPIIDSVADPFDIEGIMIRTPTALTTVQDIIVRVGFCRDQNPINGVCDAGATTMDQVSTELIFTLSGDHTELVFFPFGAAPPEADVMIVAQIADSVGGQTDELWLKITRFGQGSSFEFFFNPGLDASDLTCLEFQTLNSGGTGVNGVEVFIFGNTFGFGGFATSAATGGAAAGTVAFNNIPADFYIIDIFDPGSGDSTINDQPVDPSVKVSEANHSADEFLGITPLDCVIGNDSRFS